MTDADAMLRTILTYPWDDLPRLVYADYLDESGDPIDAVRAEFIRCSLGEAGGDTAAKACGNSLRLKARAAELLEEHEANWLVDWPGWEIGWKANSTWVPEAHWMWDRGFVSRVEMPVDAFYRWSCDCSRTARPSRRFGKLANPVCDRCGAVGTISGCAAELFRLMPVIEVLFTDRERRAMTSTTSGSTTGAMKGSRQGRRICRRRSMTAWIGNSTLGRRFPPSCPARS